MAHSQGSWRKKRLSAKGQAPSGRFEESTLYSNTYPWINESGREYASSWNFTFISDVYTGGTVWEVESSAEEDEVVERPVVKAKSVPSPKVAPVSKAASSSSSRDLSALPKGGPVPKATGPRQPVTPPKAGPKHVAVPKAAPQQSRPKASVAPAVTAETLHFARPSGVDHKGEYSQSRSPIAAKFQVCEASRYKGF